MSKIGPFTPKREEKRRKAANENKAEKSSGNGKVVLLEEGMTSPMHPLHDEAKKAVEAADDAYVGSPEQISNFVSQAAQEDLIVFGESSEKPEKAGLAPEMDEEGSIIQDAVNASGTEETGKTWDDSPFSPGADL